MWQLLENAFSLGNLPTLHVIARAYRVDFNVPFDKNGQISNNQRIVAALPTIKLVLDKGLFTGGGGRLITSRSSRNRLDESFGPTRWKTQA